MRYKLQFETDFLNLIKEIKKNFKTGIFDNNSSKETLRTPELKYIASVKDMNLLDKLKLITVKYKRIKTCMLDTSLVRVLYLDSKDGYNALFLAVKKKYISIDKNIFNYGNDTTFLSEFQRALVDNKIMSLSDFSFDTVTNIIYAYELRVSKFFDISMNEMMFIKLKNTQKLFVNLFNKYKSDVNEIYNYNWEVYDHIRNFSLNYYAMINVMSDIFKEKNSKKGFTVHDAGTSNSQLALMLSTLGKDELMGIDILKIIASDIDLNCMEYALRYINMYPEHKHIEFIQADFANKSVDIPRADVTILNDVLEHFPTDEISFGIMERFWGNTDKLLIVHVPFEETPSAKWGHFITFNKEKLIKWADGLNGSVTVSDKYYFNDDISYMDNGFLILKK